MEEEVRMADYGEDRVAEWEEGLPTADDLTPLSQSLVPPELAAAFSITPEPPRSILDVNRESQNTLSSLRGQPMSFSSHNFKSFNGGNHRNSPAVEEDDVEEGEEEEVENREATDSRKLRRIESTTEEADSAPRAENLKRPRLVWTPQLHKRFVDVVAHLGIKNAVPKTIMQLMNVDGLTRENVASHLQKYRLYLKRMQGLSNEGPSSSDQLFASTPVPQNLQENGGNGNMVSVPMPYGTQVMPMPVFGMGHGHGHVGMPQGAAAYRGFESNPYNMLQPRDWPGNKFGSAVAFPPSHAE